MIAGRKVILVGDRSNTTRTAIVINAWALAGFTRVGASVRIFNNGADVTSIYVSRAGDCSVPAPFEPVVAPALPPPRQRWQANGKAKRRPFVGVR